MAEQRTVVSVTSNGVGMGHICRQLTVLLSGEKQFNSVILSLSGALPRVMETAASGEFPEAADRGIGFEYAPSYKAGWHHPDGWRSKVWRKRPGYRWDHYLADRIVALVEETQATDLMFDGVVAYDGVVEAIKRLDGVRSTWMRRGLWQASVSGSRLKREAKFDQVIEPGDFVAEFDEGPTVGRPNIQHVAPISMTEVLNKRDRAESRVTLGLPEDGPVLLLAPGSGFAGSVDEVGRQVIALVRELGPDWTIAVTKQSIAQHSLDTEAEGKVVVLKDVFPLARYLSAFDAAVGASGYNAAHEWIAEAIPTLFIPSLNHQTDDQPTRARGLAQKGAALDVMASDLRTSVTQLMNPDVRAGLVEGCKSLPKPSGGREAANLLADQSASVAAPVIGRKFRKPTNPLIDLRPSADSGLPDVEFSESMTVANFTGSTPIEHVLPGSSAEYRAKREQAAHWLYR